MDLRSTTFIGVDEASFTKPKRKRNFQGNLPRSSVNTKESCRFTRDWRQIPRKSLGNPCFQKTSLKYQTLFLPFSTTSASLRTATPRHASPLLAHLYCVLAAHVTDPLSYVRHTQNAQKPSSLLHFFPSLFSNCCKNNFSPKLITLWNN